jgi:hypothetical protein
MRKSGHGHLTLTSAVPPMAYTWLLLTLGATLVLAWIFPTAIVSCMLVFFVKKHLLTCSSPENVFTRCSTRRTPESGLPRPSTPMPRPISWNPSRDASEAHLLFRGYTTQLPGITRVFSIRYFCVGSHTTATVFKLQT